MNKKKVLHLSNKQTQNDMENSTRLQDILKAKGMEIKRNTLVSWKEMESFQYCEDVVDMETGDVYSFIGTEGETECFACDEQSFEAYQQNVIVNQ